MLPIGARQAVLVPVIRQPRDVDVLAARVEQLRELIELLRAVREAVEEHGAAPGARAVMIEPRIGARIDLRVGGVARDPGFDLGACLVER